MPIRRRNLKRNPRKNTKGKRSRARAPRRIQFRKNRLRRRSRIHQRAINQLIDYTTLQVTCKDKFAIFGCWGMDCKPGSAQRFIAEDINKNPEIEFMVTAGDNFYSETTTDFEKNVTECYTKKMYASLGNHDIERYQEELNFRHPNWILPGRNYTIMINDDIRILMIDTNPYYAQDEYNNKGELEQAKFEVDNFLEIVPRKFDGLTFVVGHHPIIHNRHKLKKTRPMLNDFGARIIELADAYFCADEHNLQHLRINKKMLNELLKVVGEPNDENKIILEEFILGGGGAKPDEQFIDDHFSSTPFKHPYHGYGVIDVQDKILSVRCLKKESSSFELTTCYQFPLDRKK